MHKRLKCFVAMSFTHKETEHWYGKSVRPVLLSLNILPRCLIHIEHNDELNKKIIQELNGADFLIADLSFARPSVYYEAGFAERSVSVIYTCKSEHLHGKDRDPQFKVHFDLQMKNIIVWNDPNDATFRRRLARRIKLITEPLRQDIQARAAEISKSKSFAVMSIVKRSDTTFERARKKLKKLSYGESRHSSLNEHFLFAFKRGKKYSYVASVLVAPYIHTATLRKLLLSYYRTKWRVFDDMGLNKTGKSKHLIFEKLILCSLYKLPLDRVRKVWQRADLGSQPNSLVRTEYGASEEILGISPPKNITRHFELHIIDQIPYLEKFEELFGKILMAK